MSQAATTPRIFISFAGEDDDARMELGRELARQQFDAYDFSIPHVGDEVGMQLDDQIAQQIRRADLVVCIISAASTAPFKHVVQREVRVALEETGLLQRQRIIGVVLQGTTERDGHSASRAPQYYFRIPLSRVHSISGAYPEKPLRVADVDPQDSVTPVECTLGAEGRRGETFSALLQGINLFFTPHTWKALLAACPRMMADMLMASARRSWLGHFASLQERACSHVEAVGPGCFNDLGRIICQRLGRSFVRPAPTDARLPFYHKLHEELHDLPMHVRISVLAQLDYFSSHVVIGSWREALVNTRALRSLLHRHQRDSYYATIIEGLCLLRLGNHEEALTVFRGASLSPSADENALGGCAKALFAQRDFVAALRAAREAVDFCNKKRDPAPFMYLDWLTLAVESMRLTAHADAAHLQEVNAALAIAGSLFARDWGVLGMEDTLKLHKLRAHYLELCCGAAGSTQAMAVLEEISRRDLATLTLPEPLFEGFPGQLGNGFFAALADAGLFLDEPLSTATNASRIQVTGTRDAFELRENATVYRFQRVRDDSFAVRFVDKDIAVSLHEIRWRQSSAARTQKLSWLEDFVQHARLFDDVHLFRTAIRQHCTLDTATALELAREALNRFPRDPYLLKDAAELLHHHGHETEAMECIQRSSAATIDLLLKCRPTTDWTPEDLVGNYASLRELAGLPDLTDSVLMGR